jgi:hypothetical protein
MTADQAVASFKLLSEFWGSRFFISLEFRLKKNHTSCGSWLSYYMSCFNLDPVALRRKLSLVMPHVMQL